MQRIEKFILSLCILTALKASTTQALISAYKYMIASSVSPETLAYALNLFTWINSIGFILANLFCGIWIFFETKEEKLTRWVWLLFGLTFGLEAVIMFYLYMLFVEIRYKWKKSDETPG